MTLMQTSLDLDVLNKITYIVGSADIAKSLANTPARIPFDEEIVDFLNEVSREVIGSTFRFRRRRSARL